MRIAGSAAIAVSALVALHALVWVPARCNVIEQVAQQTIMVAYRDWSGTTRAPGIARNVLSQIAGCLEKCPGVNLYMIEGAADRLLDRKQDALIAYTKALHHGRRPEVYFNLGLMQAALGQFEQGAATLTLAGKFSSSLVDAIEDPILQQRVRNDVAEYKREIVRRKAAAKQAR